MPHIEGGSGSGSVIFVRTCVVLKLVGLTEGHTYVCMGRDSWCGGVPMVHRLDLYCAVAIDIYRFLQMGKP
jgi:hypothetical protein